MDHAGEHSATEAHLAVGEHSAAEEDLAAAGEHRVVETDLASELGVGEADLTEACEDGAAEANRASREYKDTVANSPVPDSASASPYGYATDSPLDLADPTGHYVTAYSGPLTPAQQKQQAAQQKASISAAAAGGARQAAAAKTAPLDAHQLHLAHLAHLAATGQAPAKTAPVKKPAAAAAKPYDGPVVCAEGGGNALTQCMYGAYRAGGGQVDAGGIPDGKGYTAPRLSPAQVRQQDNAARQAEQQAAGHPLAPGSDILPRRVQANYSKYYYDVYDRQYPLPDGTSASELTALAGFCDRGHTPSDSPCGHDLALKLWLDYESAVAAPAVITDGAGAYAGAGPSVARGVRSEEDAASDLLKLSCGNSFTPATRVLLPGGKTRPISALKPGDKVLATSTRTGKTQAETVTAVEINHDHDLYDLTVQTSSGTGVIRTTASHLFWDPYLHQGWIPAKQLKPGMHLKTPDGQPAVVVGGSTPAVHDGWMWDLTVPGNNDHDFYVLASTGQLGQGDRDTYYAGAGDTPVLVHNSGPCGIGNALRNWSSQRFQFGNQQFLLDKGNMTHILERHMPEYWDGSVKASQSFFDKSMSIQDVQDAIGGVLSQNRDTLISRGSTGIYQIQGSYGGTDYVLGLNNGHIGQFYPGTLP